MNGSYLFLKEEHVIKIDDARSREFSTSIGTPQGSVLGPLNLLLFINDLPSHIPSVLFLADLLFSVHNLKMEKKQEGQLLKWYEKVVLDTEPLDSDDDLSDTVSEHSLHNTDTEQSDDGDEVLAAQPITAVTQP
ncbi:hypothetical protein QE152_g36793 [Popillia japonica]|uniref:Reverse transcriptase domain-containing protein n=1 Tax=Popillia japonica TaxID=7064 RepID=A0AAW1IBT0_POPJA